MTLARLLLRALVWVLVGLGLTVGIFLGRLSTGPVVLDWMRPKIEKALVPGNSDLKVTVGQAALRLDESHRTIELVGLDVRYGGNDGRSVLTFPEVKVALSVEAFLKRGVIAASKIEARAPSLRLTRNAEGIIGLHSVEIGEDQSLSDVDFPAFLRHFVLAPETDNRIVYLERLQISGGHVFFEDQVQAETLQARAADLILTRHDDGVAGWLRADLVQDQANASLQLRAQVDEQAEKVHLDMDIIDLVVADLTAPWHDDWSWLPMELTRIRAPVHASLRGVFDFDGAISPLEFEMQTTDSLFDLPTYFADPLDVTLLEVKGVVEPGFDAVDLNVFHLVSAGAELTARGRLSSRDGEPRMALDLEAVNVRAEDLPTFWPPQLGQSGRTWVVENIKTGLVSKAEARLELHEDDFGPEPLRDQAVQGRFDFEGLKVRYIDSMPPFEQGKGTAHFNADRLHFDVVGGENAGVDLVGGSVTITGLGKPGKEDTQLQVLATATGPIDQALTLLDHPPLDVAKDLEIPPERTSGSFTTNLDIRMPLYDDVTEDDVAFTAEADLSDVVVAGLPRLGDDIQLENGIFELAVDVTAVRLDGSADVDGLPLEIDIEEPLVEGTEKRRILLEGRLDQTIVDDLDIGVEGIDGALTFNATLTETSDNIWVDLEADLADLIVKIPGSSWRKSAGDKGKLLASIAVPEDGPIEVMQFELTARDLRAVGNLSLSKRDYEISDLALTSFQLGDSSGTLRLQHDADAGRQFVIDAKLLDLDSLLRDEDDKIDLYLDHLNMAIRAEKLIYKGLEIRDMQADAFHGEKEWRTASFLGTLASGGKIALELVPEGDVRHLELRSDNAGALIKALDLDQRIEGGNFHLAATLMSQDPLWAEGRLEMSRFTIADAPLLARLLTVASFTGIGNLLEGEGIQTDELILPFSIQDRKLSLTDGLLRGSQLGLTTKGTIDLEREVVDLSGTIIPVYGLNRLIGLVPVIGRILTGVEGRGAFAATYQIDGPHTGPKVYVNPLSILTPGLVRDFFGGLINGTLTPPEPVQSDD
ncbi:MAG: AsmA-like C-terminal domain-containing protein [Geminicoccaceae bacterium]